MKWRLFRKLSMFCVIGGFLTVAFNNCGQPKKEDSEESRSYSKLSDDPCEDQLMNFYARNYQTFLVQNCSSCHSTGPGKGQIANKDTTVSFKDFMQIGYSKVSANAISDGHNPPYSGSHHTQTVNDLKITWIKALSENDLCKGGNGEVEQVLTIKERAHYGLVGKTIPEMKDNEEKRIEFNMTSDLSSLQGQALPNMAGAKFSVMVRKVLRGTDRYYSVHSPRIYGATEDIRVKGIFTKINGRYIQYSTNFVFTDAKIPKGIAENSISSLLSTGAVVIAGAMFPDDLLSFDFELLERTVIPPPPPPVYLSFDGTKVFKANASGEVTFTVKLDQPSTEVVTFTYTIDNSALCNSGNTGSGCLPDVYNVICPSNTCSHPESGKMLVARSVIGAGQTFNRFDWDYMLQGNSFSIEPGTTIKTFKIKTSRDIRHEGNRLLTIKLEAGLGSIQVVAAQSVGRIVFDKRINPVPPPTEMTYSKLMNGGTLQVTCTECHNSVKRDGGYDIQDYDGMVNAQNPVLAPGLDSITYDPVTFEKTILPVSRMYVRTLPAFTSEARLMPRLKTLTDSQFGDLENWLIHGAKNN